MADNYSGNLAGALLCGHIQQKLADKTAVIGSGGNCSYGQLRRRVSRMAGAFRARGLSSGDTVALLIEDELDLIVAWLAVLWQGGVAAILNCQLPDDHYPQYFDRIDARLTVASPTMTARLQERAGSLCRDWVSSRDLDTAAEADAADFPAAREADDPAVILFTSGTTGRPSGLVHRHGDFVLTNRNYADRVIGLAETDIVYSPSPLFFAYGLNSVHMALYRGATAVLPTLDRSRETILQCLRRHRPSVLFAVPTVYRLLLENSRREDLASLRLCVSAGEALPQPIAAAWQQTYGHRIVDGIGTTEVLSTFISNRPDDIRTGSTGRVVPGFELRLVADNHADAADEEAGVLWVKGDTLPSSYLGDAAASAKRFRDGWFVTNDLFRRDRDGYYYYLGRSDDALKIGGQWMSPIDLESRLLEHPDIEQCVVVATADDWDLPRPCAFIVPRPGADKRDWQKELKQFCRERLPTAMYPHFVETVDDLPRTFSGKFQRFRLRDRAEQRRRDAGAMRGPTLLPREVFEELIAAGHNQVPVLRSAPLGELRATDLLRALPGDDKFLLDSTRVSQEGRYSILGSQPFLRFRAKADRYWIDGRESQGDPIAALKALHARYRGLRLPGMPLFCGGAVGFFAYEANHYFEQLPRHPNDDVELPDLFFDFIDSFIVIDHLEHTVMAVATGADYDRGLQRLDELSEVIERARAAPAQPREPLHERLAEFSSNYAPDLYCDAIARIQEYIRSGDVYQVNLSQRLQVDYAGDGLALYEALARINPVHFASYFCFDGFQIISASPERLVRVERRRAVTRPIAGTRRKGSDEENARFIEELRTCDKENAEHAMLVDLERNDLGRVCKHGSVQIEKLMEITEYTHVIHIESEVVGQLADEVDLLDVVGATFPGGTITGVPKIRTMEVITELEPNTRGIYTGSIGYLSFAGDMDLNIVIRTVLLKQGRAYVQVGGGVVIDGEPAREYKETLNKARSQLMALAQ